MRILPILVICLSLFSPAAHAQLQKIWGDPHVYEKFVAEASKSPAYTKLRADIDALGKSATPRNTNAMAVKALFENNNALLKSLFSKAGLDAPKPMSLRKKITPSSIYRKNSMLLSKLRPATQGFTKIRTAPFEGIWTKRSGHSNDGGYPDTTSSNFNNGKIAMTANFYAPCATNPSLNSCKLGYCQYGYKEKFTVPSNPEIIAAEVKIEYYYLYTGWDTYGGITALDLVVRADDKFNSSAYNELPDGPLPTGGEGGPPTDRWKKMATFYAMDTIDTEFAEFHANGESSFTLEGYVTPGSEFEVRVGFGYPAGTKRGTIGCYHYAEFVVKKITVNYFKSAN